ncbi:hypothetical protein NDU88_007119 [Pleurodeles waltl]|uniref:Secreted protein n=1 Tax=Pleurodeles waltl TaxID=8319 RepID=A0AAV7RS37_PLEWA|nr:hypothetical protein NDU88_007119 [Pleurodeles waltl]
MQRHACAWRTAACNRQPSIRGRRSNTPAVTLTLALCSGLASSRPQETGNGCLRAQPLSDSRPCGTQKVRGSQLRSARPQNSPYF